MHKNFKDYIAVRKLHGKDKADYLFPDVKWHLWEKRINLKWKLIWR